MRLYSPVIYRWCRRSDLNAEDSADVLQEVLSAVMLHLSDFHRDKPQDSFSAWLAAITRNKVRDLCRRRRGKPEARGGTTAQRQLAEIPQPPEPSAEFIRPDAESAAWLSRRVLEMIRAEFETRVWEAFWRVTVQGQPSVARRRRFEDDHSRRIHRQIPRPPPIAPGNGRIAAMTEFPVLHFCRGECRGASVAFRSAKAASSSYFRGAKGDIRFMAVFITRCLSRCFVPCAKIL